MRCVFVLSILMFSLASPAQRLHVGLAAGASQYGGDLADNIFIAQNAKIALGVTAHYELSRHWSLRGGVLATKLTGNDRFQTKPGLRARNLHFHTTVSEVSLGGEWATFNLDERRATPYLFGGIALFHFDPYAFDSAGGKVYLKPLGTEGQGLPGYTAATAFSRTQFALPAGAGLRYAATEKLRIGLEVGIRKLFTDYLDDVSTAYADAADLLAARGPQAVAFAYRGDELPGGNATYPEKGAQRGGASQKDYFYTATFTVSFRLGSNASDRMATGGKRRSYGCPASPL